MSTNFEAALGLHYQKSATENYTLAETDSFSRYAALTGTNSIILTTVDYDRSISQKLTFTAYGQGARYYGTITCGGAGGGAGFKWQFRENAFLSLSAGPQFDSSACKSQQGFSFNAATSVKVSGKAQIYFLAARQPTVSYLGGGLWQTNVAGGYQRQVGRWSALSFDLSHTSSDSLATTGAYAGTYFATAFSWRYGRGLSSTLTYRGYRGSSSDSSESSMQRNIVMLSVAWSPDRGISR